jgi:hypothetical protein
MAAQSGIFWISPHFVFCMTFVRSEINLILCVVLGLCEVPKEKFGAKSDEVVGECKGLRIELYDLHWYQIFG